MKTGRIALAALLALGMSMPLVGCEQREPEPANPPAPGSDTGMRPVTEPPVLEQAGQAANQAGEAVREGAQQAGEMAREGANQAGQALNQAGQNLQNAVGGLPENLRTQLPDLANLDVSKIADEASATKIINQIKGLADINLEQAKQYVPQLNQILEKFPALAEQVRPLLARLQG